MLQILTVEIQAANLVYIQRKLHLSGCSAYTDSSPSHLIRISGVLLYLICATITQNTWWRIRPCCWMLSHTDAK